MLWTWDARMRWISPTGFIGSTGSNGAPGTTSDMARPDSHFAYPYDTAFFTGNYKALIRAVSQWPRPPAVIIWGLLRDSHGGVDAALEITQFAALHGVPVIAGVGTSGYGGIYYEGDHPFNANTLMRERPDLTVRNLQHAGSRIIDRGLTLNPVHPEVLDWLDRGLRWLFGTFPVAGVNLEIGDFFVGRDDAVARLREEIAGVEGPFFQTLAAHYRLWVPALIRDYPEKSFSFASYSDCNARVLRKNAAFLDYLPKELTCQWTLSDAQEEDPAVIEDPGRVHTGYAHLFCEANGTHRLDLTPQIARACRIASSRRLNGLVIYGEQPEQTPQGRRNYEAFRRFTQAPEEADAIAPPCSSSDKLIHTPL